MTIPISQIGQALALLLSDDRGLDSELRVPLQELQRALGGGSDPALADDLQAQAAFVSRFCDLVAGTSRMSQVFSRRAPDTLLMAYKFAALNDPSVLSERAFRVLRGLLAQPDPADISDVIEDLKPVFESWPNLALELAQPLIASDFIPRIRTGLLLLEFVSPEIRKAVLDKYRDHLNAIEDSEVQTSRTAALSSGTRNLARFIPEQPLTELPSIPFEGRYQKLDPVLFLTPKVKKTRKLLEKVRRQEKISPEEKTQLIQETLDGRGIPIVRELVTVMSLETLIRSDGVPPELIPTLICLRRNGYPFYLYGLSLVIPQISRWLGAMPVDIQYLIQHELDRLAHTKLNGKLNPVGHLLETGTETEKKEALLFLQKCGKQVSSLKEQLFNCLEDDALAPGALLAINGIADSLKAADRAQLGHLALSHTNLVICEKAVSILMSSNPTREDATICWKVFIASTKAEQYLSISQQLLEQLFTWYKVPSRLPHLPEPDHEQFLLEFLEHAAGFEQPEFLAASILIQLGRENDLITLAEKLLSPPVKGKSLDYNRCKTGLALAATLGPKALPLITRLMFLLDDQNIQRLSLNNVIVGRTDFSTFKSKIQFSTGVAVLAVLDHHQRTPATQPLLKHTPVPLGSRHHAEVTTDFHSRPPSGGMGENDKRHLRLVKPVIPGQTSPANPTHTERIAINPHAAPLFHPSLFGGFRLFGHPPLSATRGSLFLVPPKA